MANPDDDKMLIDLVASGDREAMQHLYERHYSGLFAFLRGRGADRNLANDAAQDAMLQVWRSAASFSGRSSVKTWIYTLGRNKMVDRHRKTARLSLVAEMPDSADPAPNPEALLMAANEAGRVRVCLDKLKPDHRTALRLAFYEDLSYEDISGLEQIPVGTVKTRIFHAKRLLLRCLQRQ